MDEDFTIRLGVLLERRRKTRPWLAQVAGVSPNTINSWYKAAKSGKPVAHIPSSDLLMRVAKALDTTVEYLLTGEEPGGSQLTPAQRRWLDLTTGKTETQIDEMIGALSVFKLRL